MWFHLCVFIIIPFYYRSFIIPFMFMYFCWKNCNKILFTFLQFHFLLFKQVSRKTTKILSSFGRASTSCQKQTVTLLLPCCCFVRIWCWLSLLSQHRVSSSKAVRPCASCKQNERSIRLLCITLIVIKHFNPCQKCLAVLKIGTTYP